MAIVFGALRDAWLIVGLTMGLLLGMEALYRLQGYVRNGDASSAAIAADDERSADWWPAYLQQHKRAFEAQQWEPYVYHRTAEFNGDHINVDAYGLRRTVQQHLPDSSPEVFMMGGSTMGGSFQRDEGTIPSMLARRFEQCQGSRPRFLNLGQSGRVFTQEVVDLLIRLRDGASPRVVVFYDGINDVMAAVQSGRPGWPQNETNRARDFEIGRAAFRWEHNLRSEARAFGYLALIGLTRLQLLQRIRPFTVSATLPQPPETSDSPHVALMSSYVATARLVQALSQEYGFVPIFVWQPTIHSTGKPLTRRESDLLRALDESSSGRRLISLHRDVAAGADEWIGGKLGASFVNLSRVFDSHSGSVYVDDIGHTYESANEVLVEALVPVVCRALNEAGVAVTCGEPAD